MNKNFNTDFIYKFHQFSNPIKDFPLHEDLDKFLLENNTQNFSKIELKKYEISKLNKTLIELDKITNNIKQNDSSYFVVYSFFNNKYLQKGNYAYDKIFKNLVKYSDLKTKNTEYEISISFFISLHNSLRKYSNTAYVQSILNIGAVLRDLELYCKKRKLNYEMKSENFNQANFNLGIDKFRHLFVSSIYIKE